MLHLIYQSSFDTAVLQRIGEADDVIFLESAVFQLNNSGKLNLELSTMLSQGVHFYVLKLDLETRGIKISELVLGIELIDYPHFVKLTEKNKVIQSWK